MPNTNYHTSLSLEINGWKCEWSEAAFDVPIEKIMDAFSSALIGHTYEPETVYHAMYEYAKERLNITNEDNED